jgi:hypothetical protein
MAIRNCSEEDFRSILKQYFTPARAISSPEFLRGRQVLLNKIDRAFNSEGKHVMIFGDRGVGKTSLARTAAFLQHTGQGDPPTVLCEATTTALGLLRDIAIKSLPPKQILESKTVREHKKIGGSALGYEAQSEIKSGQVPILNSVNEAISVLQYISGLSEKTPVILIDELDLIQDDEARRTFAGFLHNVSDQEIRAKFIICGIGESLESLLAHHPSVGRHLAPIQLERLPHDARWEIIQIPAEKLGIEIDRETLVRIGQISDGFPYYVHLIGEALFWAMFDDDKYSFISDANHFDWGLRTAMEEAEPVLKANYEKATQKYKDDYKEVLWAFVDNPHLRRQLTDIYDTSYKRIMGERSGREVLSKLAFTNRLNSLKTERHGSFLRGTGAGWYEFRENRMRGYVRLVAQREGISLEPEHFLGGRTPMTPSRRYGEDVE